MSHEAVIVSTARTPIGTAFRGSLLDVDAFTLATQAVAESVRRSGLDPALVDDVVLGETLYGGGAIARYAAIEAGLVHAPGIAHNRHCASPPGTPSTAAAAGVAGAGPLPRARGHPHHPPWRVLAGHAVHRGGVGEGRHGRGGGGGGRDLLAPLAGGHARGARHRGGGGGGDVPPPSRH